MIGADGEVDSLATEHDLKRLPTALRGQVTQVSVTTTLL